MVTSSIRQSFARSGCWIVVIFGKNLVKIYSFDTFHLYFLQLEKKCEQLSKALQKSDKEYCDVCEKAEAARQEWDFSVCKVNIHKFSVLVYEIAKAAR